MIYTSDSLRALATIMDISWLMVRHADAWEAEVAALRERLERAERVCDEAEGVRERSSGYLNLQRVLARWRAEDMLYEHADALEAEVAALRERLERLVKAGELLWPHVWSIMPPKGRFRQDAERFYDALLASLPPESET